MAPSLAPARGRSLSGRGRPAIGPEVKVAIPVKLLEEIDTEAERRGSTRAEEIRRRLQAMSRL